MGLASCHQNRFTWHLSLVRSDTGKMEYPLHLTFGGFVRYNDVRYVLLQELTLCEEEDGDRRHAAARDELSLFCEVIY